MFPSGIDSHGRNNLFQLIQQMFIKFYKHAKISSRYWRLEHKRNSLITQIF